MKFDIYCDGGCSMNPGPGGYGVVVMNGDKTIETFSEKTPLTTNNQEELKGMIIALEYCKNHPQQNFTIWADSAYAIGCITQWAKGWEQSNWVRPKNKEIKNLELVKKGYYLYCQLTNCSVKKVKGHSGILGNEIADSLCRE